MSAQGAAPAALEKLASLGEPATGPGMKGEKVTWQSSGGGGGDGGGGAEVVATACRAGVKLWELSDRGGGGGARLTGSFAVPSGNYVEAVAFDPHHPPRSTRLGAIGTEVSSCYVPAELHVLCIRSWGTMSQRCLRVRGKVPRMELRA